MEKELITLAEKIFENMRYSIFSNDKNVLLSPVALEHFIKSQYAVTGTGDYNLWYELRDIYGVREKECSFLTKKFPDDVQDDLYRLLINLVANVIEYNDLLLETLDGKIPDEVVLAFLRDVDIAETLVAEELKSPHYYMLRKYVERNNVIRYIGLEHVADARAILEWKWREENL